MAKQSSSCGIHRLLLISMIVIPAIPLLLSVAIGFYSFAGESKRFAVSSIRQAAVDRTQLIDEFLHERRSDLESYLALLTEDALSGPKAQAEVAAWLRTGGQVFQDMGLIDPQGRHAAYAGPFGLADKDYSDTDWYKETRESGYFISDVFLGYRKVPHFIVAVARRINGQVWILRATVNPTVFGNMVNAPGIGDTGEAYILNREGLFQTGRRSGGDLLEHDDYAYPAQDENLVSFTGSDGGEDYLFASARLNDGNWRLIVRQKEEEAFHAVVMAGYTVIFVLLCGGAVIVVLALFVSRRLSETLHGQAEAVSKLEGQLLQAARLAELGEMAAGFAHEINNPLQIMKTDLALLELTLKDVTDECSNREACAELKEIAEQFQIQIGRCAAITREILRFGRQDAPQVQDMDLAEFLPKVGDMVRNKAQVNGINVTCEVAPDIPTVLADPGQLQQVMINLLNNAIHAVVDRHGAKGGRIEVVARRDDRNQAEITVTDNGSGINQESLSKIFMPFFTTKAPGQGTGLGLSVCHSIIDSLGGELTVASTKGEGTTFTVRIPGKSA
ncbi:integral membrane sensor signal transduction histidine kinase [Pseudodesulfovibrio mercurii]|uniref:histidine kinase n=1 Tax=Pseudodesulfovibrio mercurii TaxID=641491 RepID=F0JD41_9BACT|nr:integral membrane sensor signal transduction histidine kinase [Pseudodesulfovibrio mercurii]